jgi:heterodisulfide reductase subunit A
MAPLRKLTKILRPAREDKKQADKKGDSDTDTGDTAITADTKKGIKEEVMKLKVFICGCGGEIKIPKDLDFGDDVEVRVMDDIFSDKAREEIESSIRRNKVVIAGPSPRVMEKFFNDPNVELVNIREQVAWVGHPPKKIKELIQGAVEKLRNSKKVERRSFMIKNKSALVVGGGIAGLETARQIANAGFKVYLVEKEPFLGGVVAKLDRLYPGGTPNSHTISPLINEVVGNKNIEILTNSEITKVGGDIGDYRVKVKVKGNVVEGKLPKRCEDVCPVTVNDDGIERKAIYYMPTYPDSYGIDFNSCTRCGECVKVCGDISLEESEKNIGVGAIVVATGLKDYDATLIKEYGYGRYPNVLTKLEFERKFANGLIKPKSVVIVNCAGSRDKNYLPYCSRVCCLIGLKEAKLIKDVSPETEVYVNYIDMRSYGPFEEFYNTVRENYGVRFIQGRPSEILQDDGTLVVRSEDILLGKNIDTRVEYVVLMTGFVPDNELFQMLGISNENDFPVEYVNSSRSVDSNPRGIFITGAAAFPKGVDETITDARETSNGVIGILSRDSIENKTPNAIINSDICGEIDCRICVTACPYGAVYLKEEEVTVNPSLCMGCGICTATCAAGANQLEGCDDREMLAQISGTLNEGDILALLCKWSSYQAADKAGYERLRYPENVKIIRIPCTGRVDAQMILKAFSSGAKGVLIAGCPPDACHYFTGNFKARKRVIALKELISQFGINPEALRIEWIGKDESKRFVDIVNKLNTVRG